MVFTHIIPRSVTGKHYHVNIFRKNYVLLYLRTGKKEKEVVPV